MIHVHPHGSSENALESTIGLLKQEARASGGLNYQGIFNHHVEFNNGHWIPAISEASQSLLHVERHTYSDTAGHKYQQWSHPEGKRDMQHCDGHHNEKLNTLPIGRGRERETGCPWMTNIESRFPRLSR
jgi:hypothetical protein